MGPNKSLEWLLCPTVADLWFWFSLKGFKLCYCVSDSKIPS